MRRLISIFALLPVLLFGQWQEVVKVPPVNSTASSWMHEVIGNKNDTFAGSSLYSMLCRAGGEIQRIETVATITGNGATVANVFQFTETVRVIGQEAIIYEVTDITTCTNVYATAYDGTNTIELTDNGIDLSGAPVGTYFTKDQVAAETYTLARADQIRLTEVSNTRTAGRPFTLTAKNGVDNFIQFRFTGDANTNFKLFIRFDYVLINGATLTAL